MATLGQIRDRVRDIVIDLTAKAEARIIPEIQQAQRELEEAHGFFAMEAMFTFATKEGVRGGPVGVGTDYSKPTAFLRTRMDAQPVLQDGTGATAEIDWLVNESDVVRLYSDDPNEKGAPRHVRDRVPTLVTLAYFEVFPLPDKRAPGGSLFSDGNWRIKVPYFSRLPKLTTTDSINWFSDFAEEYLVQQAAGKVLAFNRDREESLLALATASAEKNRVIGQDKKARLAKQRLLRPRTGARGTTLSSRYR